MKKKSPILYTVEEQNRVGIVRSRLHTRDVLIAIADWLIKSHRPVGFPPGVRMGVGEVEVESKGVWVPLQDRVLTLEASIHYQGHLVRSLSISTSLVTLDIDEGFTQGSVAIYRSESYSRALIRMKDRVVSFVGKEPCEASILALFAARDTNHPFWGVKVKGRSLSL